MHVERTLTLLGGDPVPLPTCTPADVWRVALAAGAPRDAVAQLRYGRTMVSRERGPTWQLTIPETEVDVLVSDPGCERVARYGERLEPP
jgi:hypothetical protein